MSIYVLRLVELLQLRSRCRLWTTALYSVLIFGLGACSTSNTEVKLRDPSQVSVSFRRLGRSTLHPIHKGSANISVGLRSLNVEQAGNLRRENQALRIECGKCLDGNLRLLSEDGLTAPSSISVSDILADQKASKGGGMLKLDYEYAVTEDQNLYPQLDTKWSNVEYYQQTEEPVRELGWVLAPGGFLTVVGVLVMALESTGGGIAMLLPGLALDTFGVVQLVKTPVTEKFSTDGILIQPPPPKPKPKQKKESIDEETEEKMEPEADSDSEEEEKVIEKDQSKTEDDTADKKEDDEKAKKEEVKKEKVKKAKAGKEKSKEEKPKKEDAKEKMDWDDVLL